MLLCATTTVRKLIQHRSSTNSPLLVSRFCFAMRWRYHRKRPRLYYSFLKLLLPPLPFLLAIEISAKARAALRDCICIKDLDSADQKSRATTPKNSKKISGGVWTPRPSMHRYAALILPGEYSLYFYLWIVASQLYIDTNYFNGFGFQMLSELFLEKN